MNQVRGWAIAVVAAGLLAVGAAPAPAMLTPGGFGLQGRQNLSGQYAGSVSDSVLGSGSASANFVAGPGGGLGGWFGFTFGSSTYDDPALAGPSRRGLDGIFEATIASTACSFAFRARYDAASYTLDGTYTAVSGCSGESGTFSLVQQCYYRTPRDVRQNGGLSHC